jgi:hypothetical protein|nr:MAG TPA: tail tubular protein [Caudoviricetes sp.]
MSANIHPAVPTTVPTTELSAINTMLSGIGEAPVNSLSETTSDVSVALNVLTEISREVQTEGWQWNTEDDYPLTPAEDGRIRLHPSIVRVHFREPDDRELVVRGRYVYDRAGHSYVFPKGRVINVTVTLLLPFEQLPESCRRYVTLRALRVFQERVVGSNTLSGFHQQDEARARVQMQAEERKADRPNIIKGTLPPTGTWRPVTALLNRGLGRWR